MSKTKSEKDPLLGSSRTESASSGGVTGKEFETIGLGKKLSWAMNGSFLLLFSGVLVGFVPIKEMMLETKLYTKLQLDLGFFISLTLMSLLALPAGLLLDYFGPRILSIVGAFIQTIGYFLTFLAFYLELPSAVLTVSFALDGIANPIIFSSLIHLTKISDKYEHILMSILTGIWDLAAIFGYVLQCLSRYITVHSIFWVLTMIYAVITLMSIHVLPERQQVDSSSVLSTAKSSKVAPDELTNKKLLFLTISASFFILQTNFYLTNVREILEDIVTDKQVVDVATKTFALTFPTIGFVAAILTGVIIHYLDVGRSLVVVIIIQTLFGICSNIPVLSLQYASFILYIFYRMSMYTLINVMIGKSPPRILGRNLGIVYGMASLVSFIGFPLTAITTEFLSGRFIFVTASLAILSGIFACCLRYII